MVITESKNFDEILSQLTKGSNIIILGCSECATACETGGSKQVKDLAEKLTENGMNIINQKVLNISCNLLKTKRDLKDLENIDNCDTIISLSCGNGVQTLLNLTDIKVIPGTNTLFVGEEVGSNYFIENCRACGECRIGRTAGICPITRCSKGLLNGACGGSKNGRCEVNQRIKCAWIEIYERLKNLGELDRLYEIQPIRSYSNISKRRVLNKGKQDNA